MTDTEYTRQELAFECRNLYIFHRFLDKDPIMTEIIRDYYQLKFGTNLRFAQKELREHIQELQNRGQHHFDEVISKNRMFLNGLSNTYN